MIMNYSRMVGIDPLETEKLQWKGSEKIGKPNPLSKDDPKTKSGDL